MQSTSSSSPFALPWLPCHVHLCWLSATCPSACGSVLPASWLRGFGAAAFIHWRGLSRTSSSTWSCPFASSFFGAGSASCGWWLGPSPAPGHRPSGRGRGLRERVCSSEMQAEERTAKQMTPQSLLESFADRLCSCVYHVGSSLIVFLTMHACLEKIPLRRCLSE